MPHDELMQQLERYAQADPTRYEQFKDLQTTVRQLGAALTEELKANPSELTRQEAARYIELVQTIGAGYYRLSERNEHSISGGHIEAQDQRELARFYYKQTLPLAELLNDRTGQAAAWLGIGRATDSLYTLEEGQAALEKAIDLFRELGDKVGEARAYQKLGALYFTAFNRPAADYNRKALALFQEAGVNGPEVEALSRLVSAYAFHDQMQAAMKKAHDPTNTDAIDFKALQAQIPGVAPSANQPINNAINQLQGMMSAMLGQMQQRQEIKRFSQKESVSLPDLIEKLQSSPDALIRVEAARALGKLGDKSAFAPLLQTAQTDSQAFVRMSAADAMIQLQNNGTFEALAPFLNFSESEIVDAAARAISGLDDRRAFEPLLKLFQTTTDPRMKGALARCFKSPGDERAVEPLLAALATDDQALKIEIIEVLARFEDERVFNTLNDFLHDTDPEVQEAAAQALDQQNGITAVDDELYEFLEELEEAEPAEQQQLLAEWVGPQPKTATLRLLQLLDQADTLHSAHSHEQGQTLEDLVMAHLQTIKEAALPTLLEALDASTRERAEAAATALGQLGDKRAFEPLLAILDKPTHPAYGRAFRALGQLGDTRAVEPMLTRLNTSDVPQTPERESWHKQLEVEGLRQASASSLIMLKAIDPLLETLKTATPSTKQDILSAIGMYAPYDERIVTVLEDMAANDTSVPIHGGRIKDQAGLTLKHLRQRRTDNP